MNSLGAVQHMYILFLLGTYVTKVDNVFLFILIITLRIGMNAFAMCI